jgi:hypothetical protein
MPATDFPLCPACLAFASEGGRKAYGRPTEPGEACSALIEYGEDTDPRQCFSVPAKPTEPDDCYRVILDLTLDTGEVAPVDITGTFDPATGTFALQDDLFQCQRTDGPPNQYTSRTYIDFVPTEAEIERIKAAALADFHATDWDANRLAYRRERRNDSDTQFQMGWDAYGEC